MNNYRKMLPGLTITGLLLSVVACNPFQKNLHPDTVGAPIIITSNPAPNQPNAQITFLFDAIDKGDIKSFQNTWIQLKAADPTIVFSQFKDEFGNTFLHRAAEKGNNLLLEFLLFHSIDKNTDINAVNHLDQTPLHLAVIHKHLDSIEWLIATGADPMVYDSGGFTPLHIAIIDGNLDMVERLTQGNNVIALIGLLTKAEGHTAIRLAYIKKHIDVLRYLINLKYYKSKEKLAGGELLMALEYEWVDLIEDLIKEKRIEVNQKGILQLAANKGYLPLLEYLTDQLGKDPNEIYATPHKDMTNTAAYQAVRGGHPKVLYYLLQQGANLHIEGGYNESPSLLDKAIKRYIKYKQAIHTQDSSTLNAPNNEANKKLLDAKINIDMLLGNRRLDVESSEFTIDDEYDKKRHILLCSSFYKAIEAGPAVFFPLLYHSYVPNRRKIAVNGLDEYEHCEPIHSASEAGNKDLVEYLLSMNADVNSKSATGTTPLTYAVKSGNIETVEYLLTKRAEVNTKRGSNYTLYETVKGGHQDIFKLLLNHGARTQNKENTGNTLLHAAALSKNVVGSDTTETRISIQDIIARVGAKAINAKNSFGYTPLHFAVQKGNQSSISMLLVVRADIHAENKQMKTPLGLSIEENNLAVIKQLIAAGANLNKCLSIYDQDKILEVMLLILKNEEGALEENAQIIDKLIKKADEITLRKLVVNVLTTNPQTASPQLKCFCYRLIKEHNIQLIDCLARITAEYQDGYQFYYQDDYSLNNEEILSFVCRLIEWYGVSPVDCIYQLILSKKEKADQLLYHLINKYKVSPLHLLNNAITQGREDIVSLLIGPYYKSIKNIIIKQCVAANDVRLISYLIHYDKNNSSLNNINCIISQAIKLNKLDIVQLLITKCHVDARIVVANVIKEISNTIYSANAYKFVQDLIATNGLQPDDFAIWAAATGMYEVVRYILVQYNLSPQQLIDYAEQMNNNRAVSFLRKVVKIENSVYLLNFSYNNMCLRPTKKQKNNNDPS
jgi:ankyrin repeat protein